jgi:hypothetical protein
MILNVPPHSRDGGPVDQRDMKWRAVCGMCAHLIKQVPTTALHSIGRMGAHLAGTSWSCT